MPIVLAKNRRRNGVEMFYGIGRSGRRNGVEMFYGIMELLVPKVLQLLLARVEISC